MKRIQPEDSRDCLQLVDYILQHGVVFNDKRYLQFGRKRCGAWRGLRKLRRASRPVLWSYMYLKKVIRYLHDEGVLKKYKSISYVDELYYVDTTNLKRFKKSRQ